MSSTNEAVIRSFLALWATRDAAAMADHFAEDGIYDNVPDKAPMTGRDTIRQWLEGVFAHLTRIEVDIRHIAINGDWVLSERVDDHISGDRHMRLPVMNVSRVVNGKITEFRDYYDRKTVDELGIVE